MRYLLFVLACMATTLLAGQVRPDPLYYGATTLHPAAEGEGALQWVINATELHAVLLAAPHEQAVTAEASNHLLTLPTPETGGRANFRIVRYDITADASSGPFSHLGTWYGVNENNPAETVFLDWTERGFHAAVRGGGLSYFIDPVAADNQEVYRVYARRQASSEGTDFACTAIANPGTQPEDFFPGTEGDCVLRQYRVAISAAVPYSNYHGATSPAQAGLVQSAIITTLNRVNQVFTQELSLRLQLAANNDTLYFYQEEESPFSSNTVATLINENISVQRERLGDEHFDLGHVFTQGNNNGRGYLRSVCDPDLKGGGATSLIAPEGDPFNIDYVAHEFGHQLGANHTQNNSCNYSSLSGMEPGSGSTIMGYAGICFPDIQAASDAYFHGRSIEEISRHTENFFTGGSCATIVLDNLSNPQLAPLADHLIPPGTPFKLAGTATGHEGLITYNWEQYDVEQSIMPPADSSRFGPLFRSFPPVQVGERYFPRFPAVVSNLQPLWEVLPQVERDLNFRLTVRHANASYGCAVAEDVKISVTGESGAFAVTDPRQGNQWSIGQTAQVQWHTAGTEQAAYASPVVDVLFSGDGGNNFFPLALGVPNTGLTEIQVPEQLTNQGRVLIRSVDNVFYNISDRNFTIVDSVGPPAIEVASLSPLSIADCFTLNGSASFEFLTRSLGGASDSLDITISGVPPGTTAAIIPAHPRPGGRFRLEVSGLTELAQGTYSVEIAYAGPYGPFSEVVTFTKFGEAPQAGPDGMLPSGFSPDIRPTLQAEDNGADRYQIQLAASADFSELLYDRNSSLPSYTLPTYLAANTVYYWRIRSIQESGGCGISIWNETSFITGDCPLHLSTADPVTISDGAPVQIAEMPLVITAEGTLEDLDVVLLNVEHSYLNDLQIELESPEGTVVPLFDRSCGGNNNLHINFDDEAVRPTFPCPPVAPEVFVRTSAPLSAFDGEEVNGAWTLRVADLANQDGGQINGFGLKTCLESSLLPVTFLAFTATARKSDVLLRWSVAAAENHEGFFVERTPAATPSAWSDLGFVAAGEELVFTDLSPAPATDYFYRLRQTDLDGRVSYSPIRSARIGGSAAVSLRLSPNPVADQLNYRWVLPEANRKDVPYFLLDARGRTVLQGVLSAYGGTISTSGLPAGLYVLRAAGMPALRLTKK